MLWTAAHHRIPLLTIMHNNRAYHQEVHVRAATWPRARSAASIRRSIGTAITDPNIDYAKMAKAYGMYGEGPIDESEGSGSGDPGSAIEVVKRGEPALIDVVTQPR